MAYIKEKLENAIAYISIIHTTISKKPAFQTYIYKYLALIDFAEIKESGHSVFELDYVALENGPVPALLYDNKETNLVRQPFKETVVLKRTEEQQIIFEPVGEPDLSYFSEHEIQLIEATVEHYASKVRNVKQLCEATHQEIPAWKQAWDARAGKARVPINPLDMFQNILEKPVSERNPVEEAAVRRYMNIAHREREKE